MIDCVRAEHRHLPAAFAMSDPFWMWFPGVAQE